MAALCAQHGVDLLCSFLPVKYNPFTLQAALKARVHHLDASTTLSVPHPTDPFHKSGKVLGEDEFALTPEFEKIGKLALAGWGVEPGMADWLCRYAADHFFDEIDEIGVRDGANLEIPGATGISFGFSIWMTIEECTNPAVCWELDKGFYTVPPSQRAWSRSSCPRASAGSRSPTSSTRRSSPSAARTSSSRA